MDRVVPIKMESTSGGGSSDDAEYTPANPQEDAPELAGIYLQDASNRDETTLIARDGNDMTFKDGNNSTLTLTQLAAAAGASDLAWRRHFLLMGA